MALELLVVTIYSSNLDYDEFFIAGLEGICCPERTNSSSAQDGGLRIKSGYTSESGVSFSC